MSEMDLIREAQAEDERASWGCVLVLLALALAFGAGVIVGAVMR